MATWGPNSEELALLDAATAGGTELPAGLAGAVVPAVADAGLAVAPWLPAVVVEVPAVPLVELVAPGAVVAALAPGAVTAEPVVELSEAAPA